MHRYSHRCNGRCRVTAIGNRGRGVGSARDARTSSLADYHLPLPGVSAATRNAEIVSAINNIFRVGFEYWKLGVDRKKVKVNFYGTDWFGSVGSATGSGTQDPSSIPGGGASSGSA